MRKLISAAVLFFLAVSFTVTAVSAAWLQFGSGEASNPVTSAQTPVDDGDARLVFKTQVREPGSWDGISNIIVTDSHLFVAVGDKLLRLDKNGDIGASATLAASVSSSPFIAYGQGMIYAFVSDGVNGYIQAVDAVSMESAALSRPFPGMECFSPITFYDGRVYAAVSGYDYSSWTILPGAVIGIDASLSETGDSFFVSSGLSYYWNGPAVHRGRIIAGSREGVIQVLDSISGGISDQLDVGEGIRTTLTISGNALYFGTYEGSVGKLAISDDGSIDKGSLKLVSVGSQVTSSPVAHNGRVYAGTGDFTGGTGFYAIDSDTMKIIYSIDIPGIDSWSGAPIESAGIQASPVLSSAYPGGAHIYFSINAKPGSLLVVRDSTSSDGTAGEVFRPDDADANSVIVPLSAGDDGTLYYINDSGLLFAVGKQEPAVPAPSTGNTGTASLLYMMAASIAFLALLTVFGGRSKRFARTGAK